MFDTYLFSDEWNQEERDNLIKKTAWFMECDDLPGQIIKPHAFVYGDDGSCIGYTFRKPVEEYISLKELFLTQSKQDQSPDLSLLFQIGMNVLSFLEELSLRKIYPGLIDLNYLFVPVSSPGRQILLYHPELFQAGSIPSNYPWYPSDEKLFEEEFEFFDEEKQRKADAKLIYKILTGASKGNAKIPPNQKQQELSWIYWNLLSREWKDYFLELKNREISYEDIRLRMEASLEQGKRKTVSVLESSTSKEKAYALITILRQEDKPIHDMTRALYLLQEELEQHPDLEFAQGFVLGNKHPYTKPFRHYREEYRSQLGHVISEYSFGEALIIAVEMMEEALKREERPSVLYILLDGEIKNDKTFQISLKRLESLSKICYTRLVLIPIGHLRGEGYQLLSKICMKGNQ